MKKKTRVGIVAFTALFAAMAFSVTAFAESGKGAVGPATSQVPGVSSSKAVVEVPSQNPPIISSPDVTSSKSGNTGGGNQGDTSSTQGGGKPSGTASKSGASKSGASKSGGSKSGNTGGAISKSRVSSAQAEKPAKSSALSSTASTFSAASLTSQDWSSLLGGTSSELSSASSGAVAVGGTLTDRQAPSGMLVLGIVLIAAAVVGAGVFIYLQFAAKRKAAAGAGYAAAVSADGDPEEDDGAYDTDELQVANAQPQAPAQTAPLTPPVPTPDLFTDISSSSDGVQHREEYEEFIERSRPPIVPRPAQGSVKAPAPLATPPAGEKAGAAQPMSGPAKGSVKAPAPLATPPAGEKAGAAQPMSGPAQGGVKAPAPLATPPAKHAAQADARDVDARTMVLPTLTAAQAAEKARQAAAHRAQSAAHRPPLTSNALPPTQRPVLRSEPGTPRREQPAETLHGDSRRRSRRTPPPINPNGPLLVPHDKKEDS